MWDVKIVVDDDVICLVDDDERFGGVLSPAEAHNLADRLRAAATEAETEPMFSEEQLQTIGNVLISFVDSGDKMAEAYRRLKHLRKKREGAENNTLSNIQQALQKIRPRGERIQKEKSSDALTCSEVQEKITELSESLGCSLATAKVIHDCDHGVTFDEEASVGLSSHEVRKRWPRLDGNCPMGCGFGGAAYASMTHYYSGDW